MAKSLREWVETDVECVKDRPMKWISDEYFFRDPTRPVFSDSDYFFSPADGIIIYQCKVEADACIVDIKGKSYSLQLAMQDKSFDKPCLVIGIFMTMYDVHINRLAYAGFLSYRELNPISTFNWPMLHVEKSLLDDLTIDYNNAHYLHSNQRVLNRITGSVPTCRYNVVPHSGQKLYGSVVAKPHPRATQRYSAISSLGSVISVSPFGCVATPTVGDGRAVVTVVPLREVYGVATARVRRAVAGECR